MFDFGPQYSTFFFPKRCFNFSTKGEKKSNRFRFSHYRHTFVKSYINLAGRHYGRIFYGEWKMLAHLTDWPWKP